MKLVEFQYVKQNGDTSNRAVIVTGEPQQNLSGIDVTQMPQDDFAVFIDEYRQIKNRQHTEILELMTKHDLKHNFRQFIPAKMQITETTWV
jgi:hypothetical protein